MGTAAGNTRNTGCNTTGNGGVYTLDSTIGTTTAMTVIEMAQSSKARRVFDRLFCDHIDAHQTALSDTRIGLVTTRATVDVRSSMTRANVIGGCTIFDINATLEATAVVVALVFLALGRSLYTVYRD